MGDKNTSPAFISEYYISIKTNEENKRLSTFPLSIAHVCGQKVDRDFSKYENTYISNLLNKNKFYIVAVVIKTIEKTFYKNVFDNKLKKGLKNKDNFYLSEKEIKKIDSYLYEVVQGAMYYSVLPKKATTTIYTEKQRIQIELGLSILESGMACVCIKKTLAAEGVTIIPKAYKFQYFFNEAHRRWLLQNALYNDNSGSIQPTLRFYD